MTRRSVDRKFKHLFPTRVPAGHGAQTTAYTYNGLEQRVRKTGLLMPTSAAFYAYDEDGQTLGEYDANLTPVAETIYIGRTPVAVLKLTGSAAASTLLLNISNVYADQIDTPRVITRNSDEAIVWRWDTTEGITRWAVNAVSVVLIPQT